MQIEFYPVLVVSVLTVMPLLRSCGCSILAENKQEKEEEAFQCLASALACLF